MNIRFEGKRVLVTGAGKGIGRAVAIKLAECGAEVVAVSRTRADLDDLAQHAKGIKTICLDVGNWENTKSTILEAGHIDLLVNNAAVHMQKEFDDINEEEIDRLYDINVKAIINITQIVAKKMKEQGQGGSIVNVSSIAGLRASENSGIYASTKAALDQLTRCMALEYGPYKIRVNSVNPTAIRTPMGQFLFEEGHQKGMRMLARTPLRRLGEVDDVVYPIVFLLSDHASLINGVTLPIDGGLSICM